MDAPTMILLEALQEIRTQFEHRRDQIRVEWQEVTRRVANADNLPPDSEDMYRLDEIRRYFGLAQARCQAATSMWEAAVQACEETWAVDGSPEAVLTAPLR